MHTEQFRCARLPALAAMLLAGCAPADTTAPAVEKTLAPAAAAGSHLITPTVTDLGTIGGVTGQSGAAGINDALQVVGWSDTPSGMAHAFLWQSGAMQDLGSPNGQNSFATAINDVGRVVGYTSGPSGLEQPWVWAGGQFTALPLPAGKSGRATALAPGVGGTIAGCMYTPSQPVSYEIVKWAPPSYVRTSLGVAIPSACATGIDAFQRTATSGWKVWRAGQFRTVGYPRVIRGMDPSGTGRMTGYDPGDLALYWPNLDLGPAVEFGQFDCPGLGFSAVTFGNAVNAIGQIAGHGNCLLTASPLASGFAFFWATEGESQVLPPLVPDAAGCCGVATALNQRDQVVGSSTVAPGQSHATLWGVIPDITVLQLPLCSPRPCRIPPTVRYLPRRFINDGILSRPGFDATRIDPNSVTISDGLGHVTPIAHRAKPPGPPVFVLRDINGDGVLDMQVQFSTTDMIANGTLARQRVQFTISWVDATGLPGSGKYPIWVR